MPEATTESPVQRFGAHDVVEALVAGGVDVFFANPGTSEIHLVGAIDTSEGAHPVLCLFEGVATGAADGYARASGKPAAVLLHLGPGLANGLANLHNAYKARSPMVVLVGEHASAHLQYETPLRSDLNALAGYAAKQVFHMAPGDDLRACIGAAITAATTAPCGPVVMVANADVMWSPSMSSASSGSTTVHAAGAPTSMGPSTTEMDQAVAMLQAGSDAVMLLGGDALSEESLSLADCIAQATGCRLLCETFNARHARGAGIPSIERLPYFREAAIDKLAPFTHVLLVGSRAPVAFFAAPGERSELTREGALVYQLPPATSSVTLLRALAHRLATGRLPRLAARAMSPEPAGPLTPRTIWAAVNRLLPAGAIVSDEAGVTSVGADAALRGAEPHVWMNLTGGSIGQGLPLATGAAVAARGKPVLAFHGDGGAMYTVQALWTQVREQVHVVNVIFRNDRYAILDHEVKRHGLGPLGPKGAGMFELARPSLDWVALAQGMGMKAVCVYTAEAFHTRLAEALNEDEPCLIEVRLAPPMPRNAA